MTEKYFCVTEDYFGATEKYSRVAENFSRITKNLSRITENLSCATDLCFDTRLFFLFGRRVPIQTNAFHQYGTTSNIPMINTIVTCTTGIGVLTICMRTRVD
jgi:hypothetical protein